MCGRYYMADGQRQWAKILADVLAQTGEAFDIPENGVREIFPSQKVPVILKEKTTLMEWGFPNLMGKKSHINARCETAAQKKTFAQSMDVRRCLIPASGYYEWQTIGKGKKNKFAFHADEDELLYLAGIYSSDDKFAILTRDAIDELAWIHERMPLLFQESHAKAWLNEGMDAAGSAFTHLSYDQIAAPLPNEQLSLF